MKKTALSLSKGFTLIELLVVIAIIGILATLVLANYNSARARARDAQRKSDIREIQIALELYKGAQRPPSYPANTSSLQTTYMRVVPSEPLAGWPAYSYTRGADVLTYTLVACLENAGDPQRDQPTVACGTNGARYSRTEP